MNARPAGITILAIFFIIIGGLSLLWGMMVIGVGGVSSLFGSIFGAEAVSSFGNTQAWAGWLGIITAIVQIVVGFGLLGMAKWAWILAVISVGLNVISGLVSMFSGGTFAFICGSLLLVIPILLLIYLLTPRIRSAFE